MTRYLVSLCLVVVPTLGFAQSTILYCPNPSTITITKQPYNEPWRQYAYSAIIPADLPQYGNQLELVGQGEDNALGSMIFATWTDHTFLCWYKGYSSDQVIASAQTLDHYRCVFPTSSGSPYDCTSNDPKACPLECTLNE